MPMAGKRLNKFPGVRLGLIILWLLAWAGAGLAADAAPLPARDWNLRQVERLNVPPGDTLSFAVLGDSRSNPAVFAGVLNAMAGDPSLTFAINVGDMVAQGTLAQFDEFFEQIRPYGRMPFLTVAGNHDLGQNQDLTLYREIFGPDYYAFRVKDASFIVINNNPPTGLGEAQWAWLEAELKKSQSSKIRLVFFHYPLFDPRGGEFNHALPKETGQRLAVLLRQYHVTHIFAGHIHGYFTGDWDGVPYTVTGGAGAPLYGKDPAHFFHHYLKVTLRGDQVKVQVQRLSKSGISK
jgi:serine/threonine-protein phosphatase CPPED1